MYRILYNFISGILIGTCMILPGVSGSVIAIMLGIYDEIILLICSKEANFNKIKKLFPIALGIIIGIFIFGKVLLFFYNEYTFYMLYIFIGLMLGSIPILKREILNRGESVNFKILSISLIISILLFLFPKFLNFKISGNINFFNLFFGGILYTCGKIIPGISSSFFLMILGLYNYLLTLITNPFEIKIDTFFHLLPFLFGVVIGTIIFIKLINFLLNNYFSKTYSGIIGFIVGSVFAIYPGVEFNTNLLWALFLMIVSYEIVNKLSKKIQKN